LLPLLIPTLATATGSAPNIVFILADDLGIGDTGITNQNARAAGLPSFATPNIDSIAQAGVRFNHIYAGAPSCSPSRTVMLTGFHQGHTFFDRANVVQDIRGDNEDFMWAKMLQQAGYATGSFGKWHMGGIWEAIRRPEGVPTQKGFEETYTLFATHRESFAWEHDGAGSVRKYNVPIDPAYSGPDGKNYMYGDNIATERAVDFIRRRANESQPFAAYIPFEAPHTPLYQVPANHPYAAKPWTQVHRDYAGTIHHLDQHVGQILQAIDDPNGDGNTSDSVADNTIVIFASDNGPALNNAEPGYFTEFFDSNGPYYGAKGLLWEGGIRTPFFVRWPGTIAPGSVNNSHVGSFADIMPTVAELTGQDVPLGIDGQSMLANLLDNTAPTKPHVLAWTADQQIGVSNPGGWVVRLGNWSLYKGYSTTADPDPNTVSYRLYNLATDPYQLGPSQHNNRPDIRNALEQIGIAEGFDREPRGPASQNPAVLETKNIYFTQYKDWNPAGSADFFSAGNWSGGTQHNGVAGNPDSLNWNTGPADNWLASMVNAASSPQEVSVNADASVLAIELRGQPGAMTLQVESAATLTARNGVRISSGGTLRLKGGEVNTVRDIDIRPGGTLEGEGLINGQQSVILGIPEFANLGLFEPRVVNAGTVTVTDDDSPQSQAGSLVINGDYEQDALSVLKLDLFTSGSVGGVDFDQLAVSGDVTLGGVLEVSLANPFNLALGNSFEIITAGGGLVGAFDQIIAPTLDGGLAWSLEYGSNSALLEVVEQPFLSQWRQSFGIDAGGDLDLDGDTDGADFLAWQRQLGAAAGSLASVAEPSGLGLALVASGIAWLPRRLGQFGRRRGDLPSRRGSA